MSDGETLGAKYPQGLPAAAGDPARGVSNIILGTGSQKVCLGMRRVFIGGVKPEPG